MSNQYTLRHHKEFVDYVVNFFVSPVLYPEVHQRIKDVCQGNPLARIRGAFDHEAMLMIGRLSVEDFRHYYHQDVNLPEEKRASLNVELLYLILDELCKERIIVLDQFVFVGGNQVYRPNQEMIIFSSVTGCLGNILYGYPFIVEKYKMSLFKIAISKPIYGMGSGFLFRFNRSGETRSMVITNRHVVCDEKGKNRIFSVLDEKDRQFKVLKIWLPKNEKLDLAIIELEEDVDRVSFQLYVHSDILDEVVVLGYPKIPMARSNYQTAHRGEVNAFIDDYWGTEHLLYSALTNPGNSGGPVINKMGLVVGVATEQLRMETETPNEVFQPYFSAINARDVVEFLNSEVLPHY